ncbi:hypothetical protein PF005_g24227 [Phytophthora fragariae]|uniref:Uncharacterized protein n=1 Tax=Phytophthora fragariae TaxID=53985 RepID=A0A6A4CZK9_9STRA|nr:hypothetical protein PF003_g6838 [Phytophthora fragariae]KAE8939799.1 hypothetical protein PF009_g10369 [Phytophthora fragariae]KAE8977514.1 hypothetical protein PF011_g23617 [Phytophthora fragariae]KAE9076361.1 hypothetical protein PF007_g24650 [Phytophthora fragariae]KAE9093002.1 hypothetical protein PF010_g17654 [Phytophthora fragariae]
MWSQLRRDRDEFYVAFKRMRTSYENAVVLMNELHRELSAQDAEIRGLRLALSAQHDQAVPDQPQPYDASIEELFGDTTSESSEDPGTREEDDDVDSGEDSEAEALDVSEGGATSSDEEEGDTDDDSDLAWSDDDSAGYASAGETDAHDDDTFDWHSWLTHRVEEDDAYDPAEDNFMDGTFDFPFDLTYLSD